MTTAAPTTARLSPLDGSFLRLDTPQSPMHVGWSAVFAAPQDDRPRPTIEALRERAAGRVHEVPWCRWRLDDAPLGLTEPRWIDDADFDLAAHIVQLTGARRPRERRVASRRCARRCCRRRWTAPGRCGRSSSSRAWRTAASG